jgi:hypothetical protein
MLFDDTRTRRFLQMPVRLSTTLDKINQIENKENQFLVKQYHKYMNSVGASERHQNNNLKVILSYVIFQINLRFYQIYKPVILC